MGLGFTNALVSELMEARLGPFLGWQSLRTTLPLLGFRPLPSFGTKLLTLRSFGRVHLSVICHYGSTALLDGRPGPAVAGRAGVPQPALGAHRGAHLMWRTGLRVSEVLELEWRDLDYQSEPATLLVRKSKSRRARTVRLHQDLVQLFTNWPSSRSARDKVVALSMRSALRHIGDGIG